MPIAGADGAAKVLDLPLEILHEIAHALSNDLNNDTEAKALQAFKSCSLANRSFAAAFHPYVFHNTVVTVGDDPQLERIAQHKLNILTSNPHLGQHVKHLTLAPMDEGEIGEVSTSLLKTNLFPNLTSFELLAEDYGMSWGAEWYLLAASLQTLIEFICNASTLKALAFVRIADVPASLFLSNKSISSLSLVHSNLSFGRSRISDPQSSSGPPLSLKVFGRNCSPFPGFDVLNREQGFFSRVRCLTGTTTWDPCGGPTFNTLVSALARISSLESLDMTVSVSRGDSCYSGFSPPNRQAIEPFTRLRGLQDLTLSSDFGSDSTRFVFTVSHVIRSLDTSRIVHLSLRIAGWEYCSLANLYGSSQFLALNAAIAGKQRDHQLGMLEELRVTIEVRSGAVAGLKSVRRVARECGFLSSLPEEKVRIILE